MPTLGAPTDAEPRADAARVPQHLTRELLTWGTAALEALLQTPEMQDLRVARPREALVAALKKLDLVWPYAVEEA